MNTQFGISTMLASFLVVLMGIPCPGSEMQEDSPETRTQSPEQFVNHETTTDAQKPPRFIRLETDEFGNPVALQTATIWYEFVNADGVKQEVILEGVIHVADPSYFRGFQQRFPQYDRVLYESLIRPKSPTTGQDAKITGLQMLQQLSSGTFGLAYQFDEIDYEAKNMLNADLSTEELAQRMEERGESATTLFSDLISHLFQKMNSAFDQTRGGEPDVSSQSIADSGSGNARTAEQSSGNAEAGSSRKWGLSILTDKDGIMKIRRAMAGALVGSGLLESPLPPGIHRVIIGDRNDEIASILEQELRDGHQRIAIFFGVGHMADLEQRLVSNFGMKESSVIWRNAWDLRDGAIQGAPLEGLVESTFRDSFKNKLKDLARGLGKDDEESPVTGAESETNDATNEESIRTMEQRLKALQERLDELEGQQSNSGEEKRDDPDMHKDDKKQNDKKQNDKKQDDKNR